MRRFLTLFAVVSALLSAGCEGEKNTAPPAPFALTSEAIGRYCGMNVLEHAGPKGQVILDAKVGEPLWFSSARDTLAFTMLPEEPKDYAAFYVSDIGKAPSWEEPGATNWVDGKKAFYVIGSAVRGGMGAEEAVPFSAREAADKFAVENGGKVVKFEEVPRDYVLGSGDTEKSKESAPVSEHEDAKGHDHG
ncbi:copper resistance protein CopZ [Agrobacterium tumefaciens]|uniref:nitrous oxide reductase accessory protein NosL n=1 Tax=Agrobacterium tumefaciens TaxID=358 RepID=UPI001571FA05|nr:nitrous oxide reductase accessory protein NosL [Agrobacterium tumefaciens]NTA84509.1 copper resistance protein CopZ [Agrobacterium tumefaciens]